MKNDTKLIMETWRRFLNEDSSDPDLASGFSPGDDSMPTGQRKDKDDFFDARAQGDDDRDSLNGVDEPIDGEPPFDSEEPVESEDFIPVSVEVEVAELLRTGGDVSQYSDAEIAAGKRELETQKKEENPEMYNILGDDEFEPDSIEFEPDSIDPFSSLIGSESSRYDSKLSREELEGLKDK